MMSSNIGNKVKGNILENVIKNVYSFIILFIVFMIITLAVLYISPIENPPNDQCVTLSKLILI